MTAATGEAAIEMVQNSGWLPGLRDGFARGGETGEFFGLARGAVSYARSSSHPRDVRLISPAGRIGYDDANDIMVFRRLLVCHPVLFTDASKRP